MKEICTVIMVLGLVGAAMFGCLFITHGTNDRCPECGQQLYQTAGETSPDKPFSRFCLNCNYHSKGYYSGDKFVRTNADEFSLE